MRHYFYWFFIVGQRVGGGNQQSHSAGSIVLMHCITISLDNAIVIDLHPPKSSVCLELKTAIFIKCATYLIKALSIKILNYLSLI